MRPAIAGATDVMLLADPDDETVVRIYGGLGFEVGRLASTRGPIPVTESER